MKVLVLCCIAVALLQLATEGDAVCCHGKGVLWNSRCADCSKGTPYCPHGKSCNIFGCNCAGGCRTGPCHSPHVGHPVKGPSQYPDSSSYEKPDTTPMDYPDSSSNENPDPAPMDYPDSSSNENPDPAPMDYPDSSSNENPEPAPMDYPDSSSNDNPEPAPMDYPDSSSNENPDPAPSEYPEPAPTENPDPVSSEYNTKGNSGTTPQDVIDAADKNGDGYMDMDEAETYLYKRGMPVPGHRIRRFLLDLDRNNDNFITADELDSY